MASRREPIITEEPPDVLIEFDPADWPADPSEPADVTWYPAFRRWVNARRRWASEHPNYPTDLIDQIRGEHQTKRAWMLARPVDPQGPVTVLNGVVQVGVHDPVSGEIRGRLPGEEHLPDGARGTRYCDWWKGI